MILPEEFARRFAGAFPELLGRPVLVALSGGSDSTALLRLLVESLPQLGCRVHAAHVHHHLRGEHADADAAFCEALCAALAVPAAVLHLDPQPPRGASPEAWWRGERYRLLAAERVRAGCAATATAHTLDDQAETVLLKLLRGGGVRAVAGIRRRRGEVVRPLLWARREALREWLRERGAGWRDDASNLTADRPRARLRREAMPVLAAAYPRAAEHLAAFAAMLAEDEACLAELLAGAAWPQVSRPVERAAVASLPAALRRRWVLALAERLPLAEPPSPLQLTAADAVLLGGTPAAVDLGRRWVLRRRGERLHLSPPPLPPFAPVPAAVPSTTDLGGGLIARVGGGAAGGRRALSARVAAGAGGLALCWRPPAAGERWPGAGGRSLARLLAAAGVPPEVRRAWPLLAAGGTILWVPGVGVHPEWADHDARGIVLELEVRW
jgi:tRNA(Ile)-lysidine synthase